MKKTAEKFHYAAIASAVGAVLSSIGIVCVAYSFLPGAKDPVDVDESDIVAGH